MASIFQSIFDYVGAAHLLTFQQLGILLGPVLLLAFILDHLSQFVRAPRPGILGLDVYTYLTAPGVMVHELGHAFFCVIFRHRIIRMRLFSPRGDGTLGSVQHSYNPRKRTRESETSSSAQDRSGSEVRWCACWPGVFWVRPRGKPSVNCPSRRTAQAR